ncbi:MAG TPA: TonB-dependent receptor [Candidatus Sulfopaludibacter sp.]|nr:TonB-dependent receptor [Candidatus Sulfopaludibacter sp.]
MLVCSTGVFAQSVVGSGAVTGIVRDQYGDGLPETKVVLSNAALGINRTITTTDDGVFDVPMLPPNGEYKLQATRTGFANWESNKFDVSIGQTVYFQIDMKAEEPATQVEAGRALMPVDNNRTGVSTLVTRTQLESLPFASRRLDSPVLLAPAVTVDPTTKALVFRGVPLPNAFLADGILTTNQYDPGRPGLANQLAPDAVSEMQVAVSGQPAEFDHSAGGIVNAATRTGGNGFHGDAYGYYGSSSWSAVDRFALGQKLFDKQTEGGASVGGPIMHDKLFFFLNADVLTGSFHDLNRITSPLITDNGSTIPTANCKSTVVACTAAINLILPQMNVAAALSQRFTSGVARVDYRRSDRNTFSAEGNAMNSRLPIQANINAVAPNGGLLGLNNSTEDTRFGKGSWLHTFFNGGINELRGGYVNDRFTDPMSTANLSTGALGLQVAGATVGAARPDAGSLEERRYQVIDTFNWTSYSHSLKMGFEYVENRDSINDLPNPFGSYTYPSITGLATDIVGNNQRNYTYYNQSLGISARSFRLKEKHAFAQDTWKVARYLTVTGGLNWEKTTIPQPVNISPTYYQTGTIASRNLNFAPRISAALQPNDRTVLRIGFGWFYSPYQGALIDALLLGNGVDQTSISASPFMTNAPVFPKSVASITAVPAGQQNIYYGASKFRNPFTQQANVALERRLTRDTALTINLMNSRGYKLYTASDLNLNGATITETYTIDNAAGAAVNTFNTLVWTNRADTNHQHVYQIENGGSSWYNGVAVQLRKQMGRDLSVQLSYTYSHSIDDVGGTPILPGVPSNMLPGDYISDKGNSAADQRHRGVLNWVWTPTILKSDNPAARILVNGWQFSGIATIASPQSVNPIVILSGQQFTGITLAYLNSLNGSGGWNRVPFDAVNAIRLSNQYNVNARFGKIFSFTEHVRASFAFEVYNALNNQYTTGANNIAFVATAGVLKPVANVGVANASAAYPYGSTARRAQISVRLEF